MQGLGPGDADLGHGAEGEFDDDAEGAEGEQGCAEEGQVVGCAAADELAVGEDEGEGCDGLAEEAVVEGGAVGPRGDGAGDGLDVDAAKVWDGEAVLGEFEAEVMQREAGFEGDEVGGRVDVEDAVKVVEVHHPGRGAGQFRGGVAAADDDEATAAFSGEGYSLFDLGDGLGLDVEFWS